jgi:hypothetical protein
LADLDLAANLVAGRIVSLADDGLAVGVVREAGVLPDDDVAAIEQRRDLAVELPPAPVVLTCVQDVTAWGVVVMVSSLARLQRLSS